jgi:hypothetical protein
MRTASIQLFSTKFKGRKRANINEIQDGLVRTDRVRIAISETFLAGGIPGRVLML